MTYEFTGHIPVLLDEVINQLEENFEKDTAFTLFDFTFGGGGHSMSILKKFPNSRVIAFDQDPDALSNGRKKIKEENLDDRIKLLSGNFTNFDEILSKNSIDCRPNAVLMDLGVSSHHFDEGQRGFSFRFDGPLDMRMNYLKGPSAADVVNNYDAKSLVEIFEKYGEIYNSEKLVTKIIEQRSRKSVDTTFELRDLVYSIWKKKPGEIDPCTQVFQALRIEVNQELQAVETVIDKLKHILPINAVIMIITFHSLEDRIVKKKFKEMSDGKVPFSILTKKPISPSEKEISNNKRSRSAKLRVIKRVSEKKLKNKYHEFSRKEK
ncbi:MAG: 16S rRNA (cytosine(1402)-N(4))-methyltransferase RsmH [Bdellovibrio sp.]